MEQIRVKASGEKRGRSKRSEKITERERRDMEEKKLKRSDKIRAESDKSSVEKSGASSVIQNDVEQGEYPIG